jgi:hypothetical protein
MDNTNEIKQALKDAGVPCVDKNSIVRSIQWLGIAYKAAIERQKYIRDKFGIAVIHDKCGENIMLYEFDKEKYQNAFNIVDED